MTDVISHPRFQAKPRLVSAWAAGPADPYATPMRLTPSERAFGELMGDVRDTMGELEVCGLNALNPAQPGGRDARTTRCAAHIAKLRAALDVAEGLLFPHPTTGDAA